MWVVSKSSSELQNINQLAHLIELIKDEMGVKIIIMLSN